MAFTEGVLNWLAGTDTGASSLTILYYMEGVKYNSSYPLDPYDLWRCIKLLDLSANYRRRLPQMKELGPVWSSIIDRWDTLENLCRQWQHTKMSYYFDECLAILMECSNHPSPNKVEFKYEFDVELAICVSNDSDNGTWYTEHTIIETSKENPTQYELLEIAEEYLNTSAEFYEIAAIGYYSHSRILKCEECGEKYDEKYDGECKNPKCSESTLYDQDENGLDQDDSVQGDSDNGQILITDITDDISRSDNLIVTDSNESDKE